jgi:Holliday junction DNA helicase RuvA
LEYKQKERLFVFYYLKGTIAHVAPHLAVIDCGGVGYACRTTSTTLAALQTGESAKLFTYLNVREDAMELYGFATENEKNCFQMLIGVSGVGPKAALSILSATTPEGLATSIITGNEKALTVAPGIGKKIAQRIMLELKDKLAKGQLSAEESYGGTGMTVIPQDKTSEASAALAVLGYNPGEISLALKGLDLESLTLEEIVRQALRRMMKP